jgi:outer membrane protein TolC
MQYSSRLNKSLIASLLLAFSLTARGQEPVVLSLEGCRTMAVENNKQMQRAERQLRKSGYDRNAVRALYFPHLSGYGAYLYTNSALSGTIDGGYLPLYNLGADGTLTPDVALNPSTGAPIVGADGVPVFNSYAYMPDISLKIDPSGTYAAGLKLEQPIYMGGKIIAANKMAAVGQEMAKLNMTYTRNEVIIKSDEAYWQYIRTRELLTTAEAYLKLLSELEKQVSDANAVGMVRRSDLLKVQVKRNEAELQVNQATNGVRLAGMALCHVVGLPLLTDLVASDSLPTAVEPVFDPSATASGRPEYSILGKEAELRKREMEMTRADYLPQVGAAATYGYANGLKLNEHKLLDNASFGAMVSVSVPLFSWGEGRNKVRSKKMEQEMALLKQQETAELLDLEIESARANLDDAWLRVRLAERALTQAEANLAESRDMYEVGFETLPDYLEAQTLWQKAAADRVDALAAYHLATSRYQKATGRL